MIDSESSISLPLKLLPIHEEFFEQDVNDILFILHRNLTPTADVAEPVQLDVFQLSKVWSTQKASVDILAAATVPVALALTRVPLGLPALSVSIRTQRATLGLPVLARLRARVVPATPIPNTGNETRVLAVTSPIFCADVACAVVGAFSINTTLPAERVSQAG